MFDRFLKAFGEDPVPCDGPETADAFMDALGGRTFGAGPGALGRASRRPLPQPGGPGRA